ncbi:MAG: protein-export chaperone SecB [Firmicutes bacterium]|nr:protein-export chaperone SecB [Bacillota bacterium]MCL2771186.1 protein-export chaperone SecB [Bacillota bacterium]
MQVTVKKMDIFTNYIKLEVIELENGKYELAPKASAKIGKSNKIPNHYAIEVNLSVLDEPTRRFPINLEVKTIGYFEIENSDENVVQEFLKSQGLQAVYHNLRNLISTVTAASMLPIVNLPPFFTDIVPRKQQ